jgi:hypothetical protein
MRRDHGRLSAKVQRGAVDVLADVHDQFTETVLLERIVRVTAQAHDMRGEELLGVNGARARDLAMLIAHDDFCVSFALLWRFFGARPETVRSRINGMRTRARSSAPLREARLQICETLRSGQEQVEASPNERGNLQ